MEVEAFCMLKAVLVVSGGTGFFSKGVIDLEKRNQLLNLCAKFIVGLVNSFDN